MRQIGIDQHAQFVKERLEEHSKSINDPITKNHMSIFLRKKQPTKQKTQLSVLKEDCSLFSRLYIACQSRDGELDQFFSHENQPWPPSIAKLGEMRSGTKSDLLGCIENMVNSQQQAPTVDVEIFDGAFVVQMLKPGDSKTFQQYIENRFLPFLSRETQTIKRFDIVWDMYLTNSLKALTRQKRGHGVRRKVLPTSLIPGNWQSFLRVDENKNELFKLLAEQIISKHKGDQELYCTYGEQVLCSPPRQDTDAIEPCSHEEADTRMMVHINDAVSGGHTRIMVRTADTDVVVITVSIMHHLNLPEIWIAFGVGKHFRYIPIHEIACILGPAKSDALRVFHALTGCDVVSFFHGRGKRTAWDTWKVFSDSDRCLLLFSSNIQPVG